MSAIAINRSQVIREILQEIGAMNETPPKGWVDTVRKALKKRKLSVDDTMIYNVRRKDLARLARDQGVRESGVPAETKIRDAKISLVDCMKVSELIKEVGGYSKFEKILSIMNALRNS
jgi:hypothetical protein